MTKYSGQSPIGEGITFGGVRYQPNLSSFDSPKKITHPGGSGMKLSGQSSNSSPNEYNNAPSEWFPPGNEAETGMTARILSSSRWLIR